MNLNFSNIKVLLIGDFMIDHYISGQSNRLSPEAPVPVIINQKEYSIPGGSANVAMNLACMGANVKCVGSVGDDSWGQKLLKMLNDKRINTDAIKVIKNHTTTLKQRLFSNGKQLARIDYEELFELQPSDLENIIFDNFDVIILSDYNKGSINKKLLKKINLKSVLIDPKKENFLDYYGANIITPNINELEKATNVNINDDNSIISACNQLISDCNFNYIVAKKGNKGMLVVGKDGFTKNIKAHTISNPDVTGAGDTVISALSLAYSASNDIEFAAKIANAAAATVVSKKDTAVVDLDFMNELLQEK